VWPIPESPPTEAFRRGLHELGYVDGQNVVVDYRYTGDDSQLPALMAEMVQLKVDVIVTAGEGPVEAAKAVTSTIPIVMAVTGDPVDAGFVASLARPGGNVTGLSALSPGLSTKRLELLTEAVPGRSRVAALWRAGNPVKARDFQETQAAARALGVTLLSREVREAGDLEGAFESASREQADALMVFAEEFTIRHRSQIVALAAERRLPAMYELREFVDAGGLMVYGPSLGALFHRAATYVDKILKGTKPVDLPVEQPTTFELIINLKNAQALGLTIPQQVLLVLLQATEVLQ